MSKKNPYRLSSVESIIAENYSYVDKMKNLFLPMLYYYDISRTDMFGNLYIGQYAAA